MSEELPSKRRRGRPTVQITLTDEERQTLQPHWSTRSMARATGMSQTAISRIWRAFGLKPHLMETWKLSTDPQFIDKVRDLWGCTSTRRRPRWCCAWTRRARSRHWSAPRRCCR